ncbi:MAG: hypothetical protein R2828_05605 [Saprospiraceae bacterium]
MRTRIGTRVGMASSRIRMTTSAGTSSSTTLDTTSSYLIDSVFRQIGKD